MIQLLEADIATIRLRLIASGGLLQDETTRRQQEESKVADLTRRNVDLDVVIVAKTAQHELALRCGSDSKGCMQKQEQQLGTN